MNRANTPQIKSVTTTKEGRFWALKADGKLLAIVLYKTGAFELKRLIQGLAGLPVDDLEQDKPEAKSAKAKAPAPAKGKAGAKPKPPQKSASGEKAAPPTAPATATA